MNAVVIFVEHEKGVLRRIGQEMATKGADLAKSLGIPSVAVVVGAGAGAAAELLKSTPIDSIAVGESVASDTYLLDPAVDALEAFLKERGPSYVLFPASNSGKDIAARVAVRLGAGVITEVTELTLVDGVLVAQSPKFGGSAVATVAFKDSIFGVVLCRPNSFAARKETGKGEVIALGTPEAKQYTAVIQ